LAASTSTPREVSLLRPKLGRVRELPEQMGNDLVAVQRPPLAR
jgi:hypothetical protein